MFTDSAGLSTGAMQRLTQEMRQFESIFLSPTDDPRTFRARVFTMEEELDFAGHPVLGAAAVLHEKLAKAGVQRDEWQLQLNAKTVAVTTVNNNDSYFVTMEQGAPEFGLPVPRDKQREFLQALNLNMADAHPSLPIEVLSTGLWYLFVPVHSGLERARISVPRFERMLAEVGAKFVYVLDVPTLEGRTWDNDGRVEDVATGSAAGPTGAYLVKHKVASPDTEIIINQGSFVGRPSQISVRVGGTFERITSLKVSGAVSMVASGTMDDYRILGSD
ncbi:MAG: PhzF family phenazine biosynthesis protein [Blastocatellia bacterium]